jgi:DnaJ like chaperone protein
MSIWLRISEALSALASGETLATALAKLKSPPERSVAFTIAVIALGAKMAKADGLVTRNEVAAFRQVFFIPKSAEKQAARVFNLARQDVAGYDMYAKTIAKMFRRGSPALENMIEGLFHIAVADGRYHPNEDDFIHEVARIFGIDEAVFRGLRSRFVPDAKADAYDVLGVTPDMSLVEIRKIWRKKIRDTHPDRIIAQGMPEEAITLATKRMVALNQAFEEISDKKAA